VDAVGARQSTAFVERGARAFTLLEVLIAVVVFSVVLAAMNAVFYGAMRLRNRATAAMETARPTQQALALIKRDLASLVLPGGPLSGALQTTSTTNTIVGQASPAFYTASGLIDETSPFAQVQRVSYLLADSTNRTGGRDLFRAVSRNLLPTLAEDPPVLQWLMSGVDRLAFLFYDGMQWRDLWDSATEPTVLPLAIKVQIALAIDERGQGVRAPIELVVPVTVQAGTNQTQQATGGGQ
jgi:type II secretion system protein J